MVTILSAKMVGKEKEEESDQMEITVEKVVTETRSYSREFLLKQKAQIEQDKIDYVIARDKELEDIETLLKEFAKLRKG
jgi:acetaldehyde dehydrogenase (acetylating)